MINRWIASILSYMPEKFVWLFSKRYISGKTSQDALRVIRSLKEKNIVATLDVLGEEIENTSQAINYRNQYFNIIDEVAAAGLDATFSLKPTMFGLLFDENLCEQCIREIIIAAKKYDFQVTLDMEDSKCTDKEIELYKKLYKEFPDHTGFVLQACLKRTLSDLEYLNRFSLPNHPHHIRICKGIYKEPAAIAYKEKKDVRNNFLQCVEYMFENNFFPAIATHDDFLVEKSIKLKDLYKKSNYAFEFQMLYGVTPKLRSMLVNKGFKVRVYIPFGEQWFRYATRRLRENPHMVWDIISALIVRK